jgi:hypothetical protein
VVCSVWLGKHNTAFSACDTTALWLIGLARYWLLTGDRQFVLQLVPTSAQPSIPTCADRLRPDHSLVLCVCCLQQPNVFRALSYVQSHIDSRGLFVDDPQLLFPPAAATTRPVAAAVRAAARFALPVTYWKDSVLLRRPMGPAYPVCYTLVHAAVIKAIRRSALRRHSLTCGCSVLAFELNGDDLMSSVLILPLNWSDASIRPELQRAQWQRTLQTMRRALHTHLFVWSTTHSAGAPERTGFLRIGVDAQGALHGLSSDTLHALWYLDLSAAASATPAPTPEHALTAADTGPDLSREQVTAIEQLTTRTLSTSIGFRARFVPASALHHFNASALALLHPELTHPPTTGQPQTTPKAAAEQEEVDSDENAWGERGTNGQVNVKEYHGNVVWPFEQALIHQTGNGAGQGFNSACD